MILDEANREDLIIYRISRAEETMLEAKLMAENNKWNTTANRLYYACFYAVTALLVKHNLKHNSHDGVKSQFGLHFAKKGIVSIEKSKFYSRLFQKRGEADYEDFIYFTREEIEPLIQKAEEFVEIIKGLIKENESSVLDYQ